MNGLDQLRALAERWKAEASAEVARVGAAGAVLEGIRAGCAAELLALLDTPPFIDIVLDGPPDPDAGRFVEVEDDRGDGFYVLRIPRGTAPQPAITEDEVRAVVREAMLVVLEDQSATVVRDGCVLMRPSRVRREALEFIAGASASRVVEKLAGRSVALSAEERAVAQAWRDTMDPIRGEREHNARSALLDRLLAGAPAVDAAQREVVALSQPDRVRLQRIRDLLRSQPVRWDLEEALIDRLLAESHPSPDLEHRVLLQSAGERIAELEALVAQREADLREAYIAGGKHMEAASYVYQAGHDGRAQIVPLSDEALAVAASDHARSKAGQHATSPPTSPDRIPPAIRASLDRYASAGIRTSDCLRHILAGDLFSAFARADAETSAAMPAIVAYIAIRLPAACHGSEELVEAWIARPRS